MSSFTAPSFAAAPAAISGKPTWQQTMLRISDPASSLSFYREKMYMTLLDQIDFPEYSFSLYFLASLNGEPYDLTPGTDEAHRFLWSFPGVTLELTHNHGPPSTYHAGNEEGDGFGHVAFHVDDVYKTCLNLQKSSVSFKKLPDEGRMKGLAFAYDPDKYWVEIIKRAEEHVLKTPANLSQTMIRIKNPGLSIPFYQKLGMTLVQQRHFGPDQGAFSLYFLAALGPNETPPPEDEAGIRTWVNSREAPVLELTHNHGTENDDDFKHFHGNEEGRQGFGHIGFLVDDVFKACQELKDLGFGMHKEPAGGNMKGLAFANDPDGYRVEIIKRGGYDDKGTPYYFETK